ncbi:uncharacterized protein LOC128556482 [Mercenaria mercenaria]|uniref:uncharacterized protein LOC128556482 n=1 Tax=Mercenaria mercenaria TaxID=6596 RepID=UPI00234ED6B2|nr:uncharacterized protein LOC128556482 [Mercenaria mercenaria]
MDAIIQTICLCIFVISLIISDVHAVDYCNAFYYCEDGYYCCDNDTRCCSNSLLTIGAIVGIVIGCLVFIIGCCVAVICCVKKQGHRPGQIVQPAQQPGVAIISTGQPQGQPGYGQPMYGQPIYGHQPYGQQQHGVQQPPSSNKAETSDPAYPLPPPNS